MDVKEELLRALEFSESIVVLTDARGFIRYVNNSFVKKYGYSKAEAIGQRPSLLRTEYHDALYYSNLWQTIANGDTWRGMFKNKTKEGEIIWEKATISPVLNGDGAKTGYIAVKEDITQQRELEFQKDNEKYFLDELFDNSPVGIAILQPILEEGEIKDFIIIRANPSSGKVIGRLGVVGLKISEILPEFILNKKKVNQMLNTKTSFESHFEDIGKHVRYRSFPFGTNTVCLFFYDVSPYRQTIQALEASEERYFTLVEDAPALICRFNKEGILKYVNNQYCNTFEVSQNFLMGRNIFDWFPESEKQNAKDKILALTPDNPISVVEHQLVLDNGKVKWLRWLDRALINSEGEIFEYQSIGMDLTPLKQTELQLTQHRNKLNAIVNSTVAGIGVVNPKGRFVLINDQFLKMIGFRDKEEVYRYTYTDITHPDCQDIGIDKFNQLVGGKLDSYNLEIKFLRKDETSFWGDLHVSPIKDEIGEVVEVIGFITDISHKKEFEIQLKESEAKFRELNNTKDKLFSIIAHDIKNPFNSILGFSSLLKNNLDYYSKEETKAYVEQILVASENVFKLLDDLLIWAKSQLGQSSVNKKLFRARLLVDEAFDSFGLMAKNKGVHLMNNVNQQDVLSADLEMIKFVIRNLIHNGIKFTKSNGEVRCSSYHEDDFLVLSVCDTGIGIKPDKLEILFDVSEFMATSGTSEEKGTGLGLHLSKELVEKNNGIIKVRSEVGKGTEFMVYIPLPTT